MRWTLKCMICGHQDHNLVAIQGHVMSSHGYTADDLREQTRREIEPDSYVYTFSDGTDWLEAKKLR